MAGMTDTAFRRLVKRQGGCGLVVTEMVSSEGLVRGIDRTLEYAEFTEEERPVAIQIFGGDPGKMAEAAQVVEKHRRRRRRRQHGLPGAEGGEGQRRLQPDARARARGGDRGGDGAGGVDPGDREDARGLERPRGERARAGEEGRGGRGGGRSPCTAGPPRRLHGQADWDAHRARGARR